MTLRKRNMIITCAVLLVAALAISGTLAYFTSEDEVTNSFTVGDNLDIDLTETWNPADGENMLPGASVVKEPVVTAVEGNGYMRVILTIVDKNDGVQAGTTVQDAQRLEKILSTLFYDAAGTTIIPGTHYATTDIAGWAASEIENPVNSTDFTLYSAEDGVYTYYYTNTDEVDGKENIFVKGKLATLFTNVIIPSDWTEEDIAILGNYDIVIRSEAIQQDGFDSQAEAFAALDAKIATTP